MGFTICPQCGKKSVIYVNKGREVCMYCNYDSRYEDLRNAVAELKTAIRESIPKWVYKLVEKIKQVTKE